MGLLSMVRSPDFIFCFGVQMVRMFSLNGSQSPTVTITPALAAAMVSSQSPIAVKLEKPGLPRGRTRVAQEDRPLEEAKADKGHQSQSSGCRRSGSGASAQAGAMGSQHPTELDPSRPLVFQWQSSSRRGAKKWIDYDESTQDQLRFHWCEIKYYGSKDPLRISIDGQEYSVFLQDSVVNKNEFCGRQVNLRTKYTREIRFRKR